MFIIKSFYQRQIIYRGENGQKKCKDFPGAGSTVDRNPPAKTGDTGLIMGLEDSTCCGATTEPQLLSPHCTAYAPQQENPLQREARAEQLRIAPAPRN